jgi:hypothetical protein
MEFVSTHLFAQNLQTNASPISVLMDLVLLNPWFVPQLAALRVDVTLQLDVGLYNTLKLVITLTHVKFLFAWLMEPVKMLKLIALFPMKPSVTTEPVLTTLDAIGLNEHVTITLPRTPATL